MKNKHRLAVGIVIILIIVGGSYGIYSWFTPQGAAVLEEDQSEEQPTELSNCPTGDDLELLNSCKEWKETGFSDLPVSEAVVEQICTGMLAEYAEC